jgi:hypothetical protein
VVFTGGGVFARATACNATMLGGSEYRHDYDYRDEAFLILRLLCLHEARIKPVG